jgi:hypothetical protein
MATGSCTVVNQAVATFTVSKDFVPNNAQSVQIVLTCTSGVVSPPNATISEGSPWGFTVTGYTAGATCTATESPIPAGYVSTGNCTAPINNHAGSCTIVNTLGTPSPTPTPGPTVDPASATPFGQTPDTAVGGEVSLFTSGGSEGGCCDALVGVALILSMMGVAVTGGAWQWSRRSRA